MNKLDGLSTLSDRGATLFTELWRTSLDRALLLGVSGKFWFSSHAGDQRVGYAFCPFCIAEQGTIYLHWSWCFACITRCNVHRTPLQLGCAGCGESDPLNFAPSQSNSKADCWNCGADLSQSLKSSAASHDDEAIRTVEDAYRGALLGVWPNVSLLGKVTDRAFRSFVDDMLELLIRCDGARLIPVQQHHHGRANIARQQLVAVVQDLICNSIPSSTAELRRRRYVHSLKLWAALISGVPEFEGESLEKVSLRWPPPLQRRFEAGLRRRKQQRWPYTPYQGATLCPRFKRREIITVRILNAVNSRQHRNPGFKCRATKDLSQCVRGNRVVQLNRRSRVVFDEYGVTRKFGVAPPSIPDYFALVGDSTDGYPERLAPVARQCGERKSSSLCPV